MLHFTQNKESWHSLLRQPEKKEKFAPLLDLPGIPCPALRPLCLLVYVRLSVALGDTLKLVLLLAVWREEKILSSKVSTRRQIGKIIISDIRTNMA